MQPYWERPRSTDCSLLSAPVPSSFNRYYIGFRFSLEVDIKCCRQNLILVSRSHYNPCFLLSQKLAFFKIASSCKKKIYHVKYAPNSGLKLSLETFQYIAYLTIPENKGSGILSHCSVISVQLISFDNKIQAYHSLLHSFYTAIVAGKRGGDRFQDLKIRNLNKDRPTPSKSVTMEPGYFSLHSDGRGLILGKCKSYIFIPQSPDQQWGPSSLLQHMQRGPFPESRAAWT